MTPREVAQVQAELVQTKARLANARLRVHTYQRRVEQLQQILDEHDKAMAVPTASRRLTGGAGLFPLPVPINHTPPDLDAGCDGSTT